MGSARWVWLYGDHDCGAPVFIDTKYDRAFCPGCDVWTEPSCDCGWFPPSPEKPSDG